jgi:hypothetical protein
MFHPANNKKGGRKGGEEKKEGKEKEKDTADPNHFTLILH